MKLSEKFLQIYNELDDYMRKKLHSEQYTDHSTLLRQMTDINSVFKDYYKDLKMFADMRNILVHNPYKGEADPIFMPNEKIIEIYENIKNLVLYPKKALSIAISRKFIYTTTLESNALEVMQIMNDKVYTHVPVMEGEEMIGVFSENTLLSYLARNKDAIILKDMKIEEFKDFIPLNNHLSEHFEFVGRNALLVEVEQVFRRGLINRKRIAVVYITESGRPQEKLLGMITAWDIAGKKN